MRRNFDAPVLLGLFAIAVAFQAFVCLGVGISPADTRLPTHGHDHDQPASPKTKSSREEPLAPNLSGTMTGLAPGFICDGLDVSLGVLGSESECVSRCRQRADCRGGLTFFPAAGAPGAGFCLLATAENSCAAPFQTPATPAALHADFRAARSFRITQLRVPATSRPQAVRAASTASAAPKTSLKPIDIDNKAVAAAAVSIDLEDTGTNALDLTRRTRAPGSQINPMHTTTDDPRPPHLSADSGLVESQTLIHTPRPPSASATSIQRRATIFKPTGYYGSSCQFFYNWATRTLSPMYYFEYQGWHYVQVWIPYESSYGPTPAFQSLNCISRYMYSSQLLSALQDRTLAWWTRPGEPLAFLSFRYNWLTYIPFVSRPTTVAAFLDPTYVDVEQEGEHLLSDLFGRFGNSSATVSVLSNFSSFGQFWDATRSTKAIIFAELEKRDFLADKNFPFVNQTLHGYSGLLVFQDTQSQLYVRNALNKMFGWSLSHKSASAASALQSDALSNLNVPTGTIFPTVLPALNAVRGVKPESLPAGAEVLYKTSSGAVTVFVVKTAPSGPTVAYMGFDWYDGGNRTLWTECLYALVQSCGPPKRSMLSGLDIRSFRYNVHPSEGYDWGHYPFNFNAPEDLSTIDLSNNYLSYLSAGSFNGVSFYSTLSRFRYYYAPCQLRLNSNRLTSLEAGAFRGLLFSEQCNSRTIDLRDNRIRSISASAFENLVVEAEHDYDDIDSTSSSPFLDILLSNNLIKELEAAQFVGATNRECDAFAQAPTPASFGKHGCSHVYGMIDLSNNKIASISEDAFSGGFGCDTLDLSNNLLSELPPFLFRYQESMYGNGPWINTLHLSFNSMAEIPLLDSPSIKSSLEYLDMSHNAIERISADPFGNNNPDIDFVLKTLILSHNKIVELAPGCFDRFVYLTVLDLSNNNIKALPALLDVSVGVSDLQNATSALQQLSEFYVHDNSLEHVPRSWTPVLSRLKLLSARANPSVCERVLDPLGLIDSNSASVVCDCTEGYTGMQFCEPIKDTFVSLPPIITRYMNVKLQHPFIVGGSYAAAVTNNGVTFPQIPTAKNGFFVPLLNASLLLSGDIDLISRISNSSSPDGDYPTNLVQVTFAAVESAFQLSNATGVCGVRRTKDQSSTYMCERPRPDVRALHLSLYESAANIPDQLLLVPSNNHVPTNLTYTLDPPLNASFGLHVNDKAATLAGTPLLALAPTTFQVVATDLFSTESLQVCNLTLSITDCGPQTCSNDGICVDDGDPFNDVFTCNCTSDFIGRRCETAFKEGCRAGFEEIATTADSFTCQACWPGSTDHDLDGSTPCIPCEAGTFAPLASSGPCRDLRCTSGTVDHDSNSTTDCQPCPIGSYSPTGGVGECEFCEPGTSDHDSDPATRCITCPPGTYVGANATEACETYACASGWTDHDSDSATECVECEVGHFTRAGESGNCALYRCDFGTIDHDSNPSTPCRAVCAAGTHITPSAFGDCSKYSCKAGWTDADGDVITPCEECAAGTFVPKGSTGNCTTLRCAAGTTDDDKDPVTACIPCNAGHYVPAGSYGPCSDFLCPSDKVDLDGNPATACIDRSLTAEAAGGGTDTNTMVVTSLVVPLMVVLAVGLTVLLIARRRRQQRRRKEFHIFISYRQHSDQALAYALYEKLNGRLMVVPGEKASDPPQQLPVRVFLDRNCLEMAKNWKKGFLHALEHSCLVIPIVNETVVGEMIRLADTAKRVAAHDLKPDNVLIEWQHALRYSEDNLLRVMPILVGKPSAVTIQSETGISASKPSTEEMATVASTTAASLLTTTSFDMDDGSGYMDTCPEPLTVRNVSLDLFDFSRYGGRKFTDRTKLPFLGGQSVRDVMQGIFEHQALFLAQAPPSNWRPGQPLAPGCLGCQSSDPDNMELTSGHGSSMAPDLIMDVLVKTWVEMNVAQYWCGDRDELKPLEATSGTTGTSTSTSTDRDRERPERIQTMAYAWSPTSTGATTASTALASSRSDVAAKSQPFFGENFDVDDSLRSTASLPAPGVPAPGPTLWILPEDDNINLGHERPSISSHLSELEVSLQLSAALAVPGAVAIDSDVALD